MHGRQRAKFTDERSSSAASRSDLWPRLAALRNGRLALDAEHFALLYRHGDRRRLSRRRDVTGDYAPQRLRATMIMATFTGAPLGGFVVGQAGALLLARFGWPSVFVLGGLMPLLAVPVLLFWLPESPRFLAAKQALSPRQAALLQRLADRSSGHCRHLQRQ